jgi:hypothetical protein
VCDAACRARAGGAQAVALGFGARGCGSWAGQAAGKGHGVGRGQAGGKARAGGTAGPGENTLLGRRERGGRDGWAAAGLGKEEGLLGLLGSCFGAPKVSHEEAASAEVVSKRWPKVPFHGASAF